MNINMSFRHEHYYFVLEDNYCLSFHVMCPKQGETVVDLDVQSPAPDPSSTWSRSGHLYHRTIIARQCGGVRGVLAGGAVEVAAWPEKLLSMVVLSSALGAPVEAHGRSAVPSAFAASRSCGVLSLEPAFVRSFCCVC